MHIVLMEDERDIADAIIDVLENDRFDVVWVRTPEEAIEAFVERDVAAAVLDVMIGSNLDAGFDLARHLRESGYPGAILFLSARDATEDRVRGLDLGADDYLAKPFSLTELAARVRALTRRAVGQRAPGISVGDVHVDLTARSASRQGRPVDLSRKEFEVLEWLALHRERTVPTQELVEGIFPSAASGAAVVRVYVRQLRQKLGRDVIATVRGGYRVRDP
ncbi:MAG: response regulator transcription factor [Trueperaceae bacterium]|nr:response regulator transcription factor [Trueperaceae bacterium]